VTNTTGIPRVLASPAILASCQLGTAVTVPYFRNPIDMAMAFATMSELANGKEISLGLGPGSRSILTRHVVRTKPLTIMAELAVALRTLFAGGTLNRRDIPTLADYFHLNSEHYALRFKTPAPIHLYYGPSLLKPAVLDLVARHFDGVILQTLYGIDDMEASLSRLNAARLQAGAAEPLRKTMLLNASVSRDPQAARQHAKRFVSHIVSVGLMTHWQQRYDPGRFRWCARPAETVALTRRGAHARRRSRSPDHRRHAGECMDRLGNYFPWRRATDSARSPLACRLAQMFPKRSTCGARKSCRR
jgi:alkanesulfonate monooxygenase SsuD/methylene tetrahydromethanopterin reductase-like flavin-dependent oxidoreductase (luciferase family)